MTVSAKVRNIEKCACVCVYEASNLNEIISWPLVIKVEEFVFRSLWVYNLYCWFFEVVFVHKVYRKKQIQLYRIKYAYKPDYTAPSHNRNSWGIYYFLFFFIMNSTYIFNQEFDSIWISVFLDITKIGIKLLLLKMWRTFISHHNYNARKLLRNRKRSNCFINNQGTYPLSISNELQ